MPDPKKTTIVILGASGDLTRRKLIPAFYNLHRKDRLPDEVNIIGFARTEWDDAAFRKEMEDGVKEFSKSFDPKIWKSFVSKLYYTQGDLTKEKDFATLSKRLEEIEGGPANRLYYLAIAPRFFAPTVAQLGKQDMAREDVGWRNLIVEKPFGTDLKSAKALGAAIHEVFQESQVYRIDHYLGKETAQNIIAFRFANLIFEPIWNHNYIDNVQITVAESVDVGRRAGYYDKAGVMRDMFQNHILQLLTLVAMEPPAPYNATTLRNEKVKVLSAIRPIDLQNTVRAQYEGYLDAPGVAADSQTPTYAALKIYIDNWRWKGVPFYLRSGKALPKKASEVTIVFKRPPFMMFGAFQDPTPNILSICIQPDEGIHLMFDAKVPDQLKHTKSVGMEFHYNTSFELKSMPDAYERLLLDALLGDASLFARIDEIETAWGLIDPIIQGWIKDPDGPPVDRYKPGTWGPQSAENMLARHGRIWHMGCGGHS